MSSEQPLIDLNTANPKEIYLNRELTWLSFNRRVLAESMNAHNPLLERVKFLAIVANNLDEFFMKRIGGLKQQVAAGMEVLSKDGRHAQEQIDVCYAYTQSLYEQLQDNWCALQQLLAQEGIEIVRYAQLSTQKQAAMRAYFYENIYPLLTPQVIDSAHPFPFVSNLSLNLLIGFTYPNSHRAAIARLKVPVGQGSKRFIRVGEAQTEQFVLLEEVIGHNLDLLFPEMRIDSVAVFRVTRNAVTEKNEETADDLLELIEGELRERRFAPIVRLQCEQGMNAVHKGMLAAELALDEIKDTFEISGMIAMKDLFEIAQLPRNDLKEEAHYPVENAQLINEDNIFHAIRRRSILIQHPYESFHTTTERFLRDASRDPKVIGIKMTLYRTNSDSKIIEYLTDASRNGKQVTVVVEVKARFDEFANIRWANYLEEAGIHVTYGIVGLKTHAKLIYVLRQDYNGLRRYAHIGTGNYHSGTARMYSDFGLLTADAAIGQDLTELFNYLTTGITPNRHYHKLLPAPKHLKPALLAKIEREIAFAKAGKKAVIQFKTNALEDIDISRALYRASQAGVKIDLIVRDSCRVIAGIKGLSETIRVISVVGRFLEHARVYYFYNDNNPEYYIGSADLMHRNLESRVEVIVPLEDSDIREKIAHFLKVQLNDCNQVWEMQPDGSYQKRAYAPDKRGAQQQFIEDAQQRYAQSSRIKHRKTKNHP